MRTALRAAARAAIDRLRGEAPRFDRAQAAAFAGLEAELESVSALIGAAAVSTWEVLLADLGRALAGSADQRALIERCSDALVPTQEALQAAGRLGRAAVAPGLRAAIESGRLADVLDPVRAPMVALGAQVEAGWARTVAYLDPVIVALGGGASLRAALAGQGPALRAALDAEAARLAVAFGALRPGPKLEAGLREALGAYQKGVGRALEVGLYAARTALVAAVPR